MDCAFYVVLPGFQIGPRALGTLGNSWPLVDQGIFLSGLASDDIGSLLPCKLGAAVVAGRDAFWLYQTVHGQ